MKYSQSICAIDVFKSNLIINELVKNGMTNIHIDFMDGHYVDNFGFTFENSKLLIDKYPNIDFDAHLMIKNPLKYLNKIISIGFKTIFLPVDEIKEDEYFEVAKKFPNINFGIMLKANDSPENYKNIIINSKVILLMTINKIGTTGELFNENLLIKIKKIKLLNSDIKIFSDGGLRVENVAILKNNNIDVVVGGSIIFSFSSEKEFMTWWKKNNDNS
ncbi:beta/alpha barrel domain-containing protein [Mycoplasmopsis cricetuli]|uniref:ribulose-phosphate 3-epimerase n=1 Tax=Mycoplasmopsis cricetuli TaxID=171283 RepID=UPI0004719788|nr:ribulose-phosphate 3-epimerase [Mycoplasmopsis cricetuli]